MGVVTSLHFSTLSLPPEARLAALRQLFEDKVRLDIDAAPGHAVEMSMHVGPGLRRARMLSSLTARMERPRPRLEDGEDSVCLMIKTGGSMMVQQSQRQGEPRLGDGVLLVYREPALLAFHDATYLSIRIPYEALTRLGSAGDVAARCIRRETEALSLLQAYVAGMPNSFADPQLARLAATHVYDLIFLALGGKGDDRAAAELRGARAARLAAIKQDLANDACLSLQAIALRRGISPRSVQMLFENEGTTFSRHVLGLRLDEARRLLASPRHARLSVTAVALEAGFDDLSYFNRSFKRRFLMTPTEFRHEERLRDGQAAGFITPTVRKKGVLEG